MSMSLPTTEELESESLTDQMKNIQISERENANHTDNEDDNDTDTDTEDAMKIPILRRALEATASSKKIQDIAPICVLVVGMAGSGKTTLMSTLQRSLAVPDEDDKGDDGSNNDEDPKDNDNDNDGDEPNKKNKNKVDDDKNEDEEKGGGDGNEELNQEQEEEEGERKPVGYCLNLDPATKLVPFGASIDIRDTVDYKEVMKQHKLGPNGAIMTSLNLFSTKFDQVISILDNRAYSYPPTTNSTTSTSTTASTPAPTKALDYILVDTPGQIEAFTWSASGSIITSALASSFPTILAFVVDTPRCATSLNTFMSNMLYACSMFYRTRLPLVVVFNKCDVVSGDVCMEWMEDYETFQTAMDDFMASDNCGYYASLSRSLSLVLDEFYQTLHRVAVSAATGDGVEEFWEVVQKAAGDFEEDYVGDLKCRVEEQKMKRKALAKDSMNRLQKDVDEQNDIDDDDDDA